MSRERQNSIAIGIVLAAALVLLSSCHVRPYGNGEGISGDVHPILSFGNGRIRCDYTKAGDDLYRVLCSAVVMTSVGNEVLAEEIEPGTNVKWKTPEQIEGTPVETLSCSIAESNLSQTCDVELQQNTDATMRFKMELANVATSETRDETADVKLPYSVRSFFNVPTTVARMPHRAERPETGQTSFATRRIGNGVRSLAVQETARKGRPPIELGVQTLPIPPVAPLGSPQWACVRDQVIFFSVKDLIYRHEKNGNHLHAGTTLYRVGVVGSVERDFSHRLRFKLGENLVGLGCLKNGLVVSDLTNYQLLWIPDNGPIKIIAGDEFMQNGVRIAQRTPDKLWILAGKRLFTLEEDISLKAVGTGDVTALMMDQLAVGPDGALYATPTYTGGPGGVYRYTGENGFEQWLSEGAFPGAEGYFFPTAFAVDESGNIVVSALNTLYKVTPEKSVSVLASDLFFSSLQPYGRDLIGLQNPAPVVRKLKTSTDNAIETLFRTAPENQSDLLLATDPQVAIQPYITDLAFGQDGSLYFTDLNGFQLHRLSADGTSVEHLNVFDSPCTVSGVGSKVPGSWNRAPLSLSRSPAGDLFVFHTPLSDVWMTPPGGGQSVPCVPWEVPARKISADGEITSISQPESVYRAAVANDGTIYYSGGDQIFRRVPGEESDVLIVDSIPGMSTALNVVAMAVGPDNALYFTDRFSHSVFRVPAGSSSAELFAGWPAAQSASRMGFSGDGGPANQARLSMPQHFAFDNSGNVFIADSGNQRVRLVRPVLDPSTGQTQRIISTYFGGDNATDCSGKIEASGEAADVDAAIQSALSSVCYARISAMAVRNTCSEEGGVIEFAFAQGFGHFSNIIRVSRGCPR